MGTRVQVVPAVGPPHDVSSLRLASTLHAAKERDSRSASASAYTGQEAAETLTPVGTILAQFRSRQLWREAASTVTRLVWESALGGAIGWCANYVFSLGNFVSGESAKEQSYASFCAGVTGITSLVLAASMLVAQAASMLRLHFVDNPSRHPTLGECIYRLLRRTWMVYVLSFVLAVGSAYTVASLPISTRWLKLHFYVSGIFINLFTVSLDLGLRRIFQLETTEGRARGSLSYRSTWKTILRLTIKDGLLSMTVYLAAVYVQISTALNLQTSGSLLIFSAVSYGFKLLTQEVTKAIILHQKKTHVKTIYLAVAVPTVLIDTQIRVTMLRQPNVTQSFAGSVALAIVETVFRFAKVWLIRLEIWVREKKVVRRLVRESASSKGIPNGRPGQPQSPTSVARWWRSGSVAVHRESDAITTHPEYIAFVQWRRRLVRFHAAEIHADMYAEYLAIVCSMSIYFFFHAHPKYAWSTNDTGSYSLTGGRQQAAYLAVQIVMEMVVDLLSCLWELANGVPLQNFKQMRGFVTALFACCAVTNIVLSAAISINSTAN